VVGAAYVVFGITGFGATVIIVPLLAQVLPLKFLVPLCVVLDLAAFVLLRAKSSSRRSGPELAWLLPPMLVGMVAGVFVLTAAPEKWLLLGLGVFITCFAIYSLATFRAHAGGEIARGWALPLGFAGGVFGAMFGIGGPLYAIYVSRRVTDTGTMRATMSVLILISGVTRFVAFVASGLLLSWPIFGAWLFLLPFTIGGAHLGMKLHDRLSLANVRRVIYVILLLSGASLIARFLTGTA